MPTPLVNRPSKEELVKYAAGFLFTGIDLTDYEAQMLRAYGLDIYHFQYSRMQ